MACFDQNENTLFAFGGQHGYPEEDIEFMEGNNSELYALNLGIVHLVYD